MDYIILENEDYLSDSFLSYINKNNINHKIIFEASQEQSGEVIESFKKHQILLFQPTQLTFSQYNLMMMIIYQLLKKNENSIKEIHIFTSNEGIDSDLRDLWEGKRMYLDEVIKHVKIFRVYNYCEPQELHI